MSDNLASQKGIKPFLLAEIPKGEQSSLIRLMERSSKRYMLAEIMTFVQVLSHSIVE